MICGSISRCFNDGNHFDGAATAFLMDDTDSSGSVILFKQNVVLVLSVWGWLTAKVAMGNAYLNMKV